MSKIVATTIINYIKLQNEEQRWLADNTLSINYFNENKRYIENSGSLELEITIEEQEYQKIEADDRIIGEGEYLDFERGMLIVFIRVDKGFGDKHLLAQEEIKDNFLKTFSGSKLLTSDGRYIKFGDSASREFIEDERKSGGQRTWMRLDVLIDYYYSSKN